MTVSDEDDAGSGEHGGTPPRARPFSISTRMSYILIGGAAIGGIVLMCLTVLILVLLLQE